MRLAAVLVLATGCFDPHLAPCAIEGQCPPGATPDADANLRDDSRGAGDASGPDDAMGPDDSAAPAIWNGTYNVSIYYVNPPSGCDFFPRVVIAGVDPLGYGEAHWYGGGTSTADIYFPEAEPNEIRFGLFTATDDVLYAEWVGVRRPDGSIFGEAFTTSDVCTYGVELTRE